jgi:pseudomonalisin
MLHAKRRPAVLAAILACTVVGSGVAVGQAAAASAPTVRTTVLTGDVLPGLAKATDLGKTAAGTPVEVGITLARPHPAAEAALKQALYTKGSASYHHFLTPAQFDARFGVATADYNAVRSWTTRRGLSVAASPASHDYLLLSGDAAQASATFGVRLRNFTDQTGKYFANVNAPTVPAGEPITGVIGLNSKLKSTTFATRPAATRAGAVVPNQDNCTAGTCIGLTTPQDLWSVYDQPGNNYGQGQRMAIFGEGQTAPVISNLRTFEGLHGLPQIPVKVVHADGPKAKYTDNAGEVEWDLDTQSSSGMAPKALGETLYFGKDLSDASVLNVFNKWADDDHGPLQASASYGECEENPVGNATATAEPFSAGIAYTKGSEQALTKAVIEGRTLFSSTGDTGSSCPVVPVDVNGVGNEAFPVVNYPASSPNVVAVGGTVLYTDKDTTQESTGFTPSGASRVDEYSWNYTGGGTSVTFPKPAFQNGIAAIDGECVQDDSGNLVTTTVPCRGIPDIAAQSGDVASNGYGIVAGGETAYPGGGTSLSSPLSLGLWTRIQAAARSRKADGTTTYPGLGFADPTYYADAAAHAADFFDIGATTNGSQPNSNGSYTSGPGWDYLSGLGTLDVTAISNHVNGTTAPTHRVLPTYPKAGGGSSLDPCAASLFTDAKGDDAYLGDSSGTGGNPQLDILNGKITDTGKTLHTTITIANLSKKMAQSAGAANDYYFLWTYKKAQYFSVAEVDTTTGAVTYHDGTVDGNEFSTANDDTGSFTAGKHGTVEVNVPLAHVGTPSRGDVLLAPAAQTRVLVGTSESGGLIEQADVGGPTNDYKLGQVCSKAGRDHAAPKYRVRTKKFVTRHHRRTVIIRVSDAGSGIARRGHIRLKYGAMITPHSRKARHYTHPRRHIVIRAHRLSHRHKTLIRFTVRDKAGNLTHVHKRF